MADGKPKVLLTGATGYIGGSILAGLLASSSPCLSSARITCLIRGDPSRAAKLIDAYGEKRVCVVFYDGLDDVEATVKVAAEHDLVINTTDGYHTKSTTALIEGLAKRKNTTGKNVWMIHTSGTSNLSDQPVSGKFVEATGSADSREFDDESDDIYAYEMHREELSAYGQRTTELNVINKGLKQGVRTLVIMSPTIYGCGIGLFNNMSIQIPLLLRVAIEHGRPLVVGEGKAVWDHVHVQDVAKLYELVVSDVLDHDGRNLPVGEKGIIFSANGRHSWLEVGQRIGEACYAQGRTKTSEVDKVSLAEGAKLLAPYLGKVDEDFVELALASNARSVSSFARKRLGWKPSRGEEAWKQAFKDDLEALIAKTK